MQWRMRCLSAGVAMRKAIRMGGLALSGGGILTKPVHWFWAQGLAEHEWRREKVKAL